MRTPSILVIFLIGFNEVIGFRMTVPFISSFCEHFGAHGVVIGVTFASFIGKGAGLVGVANDAVATDACRSLTSIILPA